MRISTKGRYALRMLVYLAASQTDDYISLKEIAGAQGISKKYLEQIVPLLSKAGILRTNRGNKGGYRLAGKPSECTVGEILRATEGSLAPVSCLEFEVNECEKAASCATLPVWKGLYRVINEYLDSVSLQDLLNQGGGNDYCI